MKNRSFTDIFKKLFRGLLDIFFPVHCLFCSNQADQNSITPVPICPDHVRSLPALASPFCRLCGFPLSRPKTLPVDQLESFNDDSVLPPEAPLCGDCRLRKVEFEFVLAGFPYENQIREIIHDWKFGYFEPWGDWLGGQLAELLEERFNPQLWDCLVPVPLYFRKKKRRGFNQSDQLAERLGREFNLPVRTVLKKQSSTAAQSELDRQERLKNLGNCFRLKKGGGDTISQQRILIVDDIYTTGTTLRNAGKTLQEGGAKSLGGILLARSLPRRLS